MSHNFYVSQESVCKSAGLLLCKSAGLLFSSASVGWQNRNAKGFCFIPLLWTALSKGLSVFLFSLVGGGVATRHKLRSVSTHTRTCP